MAANWNQLIERYLNNELSAEGKTAFETELERNTELQKEVELHRLTHELIQRSSLRRLVQQSGKWFHLKKLLVKGTVVLALAAALAATAYILVTRNAGSKNEQSEHLEQSTIQKLDQYLAFDRIEPQYFRFTGKADVFLSESGVLLSLTEQSFLLNGKPYDGEALVQWQEVQTPAEIVKAGLSTRSGDRLLETQGMFSLNAFTPDGKKLELSDDGVYVQVPVDEVKNGMKLFRGIPQKDGQVDWQNPVELERIPKQKPMSEMDLYPPKYEPKLNELKWFPDKKKRDSLYLSFDENTESGNDAPKPVPNRFSEPVKEVNRPVLTKTTTINPVFNSAGNVVIDYPKYTFINHPSVTRQHRGTVGLSCSGQYNLNLIWSMLDDDHARLLVYGEINSNQKLASHPAGDLLGLTGDYPELTFTELKSEQHIVNGRIELAAVYDIALRKKGNLSQSATLTIKTSSRTIMSQNLKMEFQKMELPKSTPEIPPANTTDDQHIPPSKVLAVWNPKFDHTILATQEFEDRMKAIHETCNEKVFNLYVKNLNEPLWKLDERAMKMGYANFKTFADQRVGRVRVDDAHQKNLDIFYKEALKTIRERGKKELEAALKKERDWDRDLQDERQKEVVRKGVRESINLNEEYAFNLAHVGKQLGKTLGFQMHGGGTIVNIDRYVWDATIARESTLITDPETGKTAKITYEPLTLEVATPGRYDKLFLYLFSKEINSYQRLDFKEGKLNYNLNGDMNYSAAIVGINENGYFYHPIHQLEAKDWGMVTLEEVSEKEFEKRITLLNNYRTENAMSLKNELAWIFKEKANYTVQKKRRENQQFRKTIRPTIYSCIQTETAIIPDLTDSIFK